MSNKFYQPGEQRAAKVGDLFGAVAKHYDLINDLQSLGLHRRWKKALLNLAQVKSGDQALDVCCGTGDIAFALEEAGAMVMGLDFSPAMLEVAERRAGDREKTEAVREKTGVRFLQGDAMNLPFADNSFDIVTVGYGLRNLADWARGVEEMARVARPGGKILILEFAKPKNAIWRGIYFAALKFLVPIFGRLFCRDADTYAYIAKSLEAYPAQQGVVAKLRSMGCADIQERLFLGGAMSLHAARVKKDC